MKISLEDYDREKIEKHLSCNSIAQKLFGARLNSVIKSALNAYEQKHRHYHSISHLESLFYLIELQIARKKSQHFPCIVYSINMD